MKIGFNLLLWTGFVDDEQLPLLEKLKATGYDGVEIPLFDGTPDHYAKLKKKLDDIGLATTTVTAMPGEQASTISPDASARAAALDHIKWAIDCSAALDADILIGPMHQALGSFSNDPPTEQELQWTAEVHRQAGDHAQQQGMTLGVEYLNRFECYLLTTLEQAVDHVNRVGHPNVKTMYDTFHANIEEKDPVGVVAPNIDAIAHVHISENDRGTPGRGHVDFPGIIGALKKAGYDGWLTIESFGRALPDLAAATRVWRDFFSSPEQVYQEGIETIRRCWDSA